MTLHGKYAIAFYLLSKLLQGNMFYKIQLGIYVDRGRKIVSMHCSHATVFKKIWQLIYPPMAAHSLQSNGNLDSTSFFI